MTTRVLIVLLALCMSASAQDLDHLAIDVKGGTSREFLYTNKESGFYYGNTGGANTSSWQGFNVGGHEFLDDYLLLVDGSPLDRATATRTRVYPDYLERTYPGGITEQLRPIDGKAACGLIITSPKPIEIAIVPLFADGHTSEDFSIELRDHTLLISRITHPRRTPEQDYPVWLAVGGAGFLPDTTAQHAGTSFSPARMISRKGKTHVLAVAVGDESDETASLANSYTMSTASNFFRARRNRMERLLRETAIQTDDDRFDKAIAWATLSLDALVMDHGKGIYAGLPWFNNYWGRDTFISLPGAALVTGQFSLARQIISSFAEFQKRDSGSTDYGRIPNIVTPTDRAYNTADGTPRFVMMIRDYVERSGDSSFVVEMYPVILRSIEGTIRFHCDSLGFLTHGDAETWMDAVGPDGPWSPRGNRANDVQALWAGQLSAGIWCASILGDAISARRWNDILRKVQTNFPRYFVTPRGIADHLNADGSPDKQLRPNQVFVGTLLPDAERARMVRTVTTSLTYPYGVASLSQDDENFHPYHHHELYPKDAAYHNGVVWTWLQGRVISELCRFGRKEVAYELTRSSINQILDRGAVGTQSELLDAVALPGANAPAVSGTASQAWNLAEFIRNFYDDYLGIKVVRYYHKLVLRPMLPGPLGSIRALINLDGKSIPVSIHRDAKGMEIVIDGKNLRVGGTAEIEFRTSDSTGVRSTIRLQPRSKLQVECQATGITSLNEKSNTVLSTANVPLPFITGRIPFATPTIRSNLGSLKPPSYPLLRNSTVKAVPQGARIIVQADDPKGDDIGVGASPEHAYTYPANPAFLRGSFDIRRFSVSVDTNNVYFSLRFDALSNPGWHPEYGFQLTFVAIAVDEDTLAGSGQRVLPANAQMTLDDRSCFEKVLLIGGGFRLEDARGNILCAYVPAPADVRSPLGDVVTSTISFAVPRTCMGTPKPWWRWTVLAGAQDDHGGAGLGEFRTVKQERGEWNGGGKAMDTASNVYDMLIAPPLPR